ncbi:hypothetical protein P5P86_18170 [Nocardioides sp. BP30]|uniref:beta family protein n=1 Tax=Nocardioides sp. BP30 TaxID=3036374 RepID=UPI002468FAE4|nr:hypothetical protein [Nocardioides sp. BP30]WGL51868.1 hypothetical protein P5P86_18170 [Nocardioides sp. BP30]
MKAKPGEFQAIGELGRPVESSLLVIYELCSEADGNHLAGLYKALGNATKYLPGLTTLAFGCSHVPLFHSGTTIPLEVSQGFANAGMRMLPVVGVSDPGPTRTALAVAAAIHGQGAILRHSVGDIGSAVLTAGDVATLSADLGVPVSRLHLVIDFAAAVDAQLAPQTITAAKTQVAAAAVLGSWASITVASGAFPVSISNLQVGVRHDLQRREADLWSAVIFKSRSQVACVHLLTLGSHMQFILIFQWTGVSDKDFDALVDMEDSLELLLDSDHGYVDGHDFGAGEMNIFVYTIGRWRHFEKLKII